jgi:hypothetical protein
LLRENWVSFCISEAMPGWYPAAISPSTDDGGNYDRAMPVRRVVIDHLTIGDG